MNAVAFADVSSQILFSGGDDAICKVWDRRTMREDDPKPVGALAGHQDGITFIDSKVGAEAGPVPRLKGSSHMLHAAGENFVKQQSPGPAKNK